ncbi:MAG: tyrosine-type recombinase/integrase [Thermoplasmatota archaeon]
MTDLFPPEHYTTKRHHDSFFFDRNERVLASLAESVRPFIVQVVQLRRLEGLKESSTQDYLNGIRHICASMPGHNFVTAPPEAWIPAVPTLRKGLSQDHAHNCLNHARSTFKKLEMPVPKTLSLALKHRPEPLEVGQIISPEAFAAMCQATAASRPFRGFPVQQQQLAILHGLAYWGFRASELISMNVTDFKVRDDGTADASCRKGTGRLKRNKPRTISDGLATKVVAAWLAVHPYRHDPNAPLFLGWSTHDSATPFRRASYELIRTTVGRLDAAAGASRGGGYLEPFTPHDFRHTLATNKALNGWVEGELRTFFGWSRNSQMPSHYVHNSLEAQRAHVLRDLGLAPDGFSQTAAGFDYAEVLASFLKHIANGPNALKRLPTPSNNSENRPT